MAVTETFFAVDVRDMDRATAFYVDAFGATVVFTTPNWTSIHIAGVRLGLALSAEQGRARIGLHFAVSDLAGARADVERLGGRAASSPIEVASGVVIAEVTDTEGNTFTLTQR